MKNTQAIIYFLFAGFFSLSAFALPGKFFEVSPGIYRSAQPTGTDMDDLKKFGIKTILDLNDDAKAIAAEKKAASALNILFISHAMNAYKTPNDKQVDSSLALLQDQSNYPILVHCKYGEDRTGLIIGLHRVEAESWTPANAYNEMLDRGFHKALYKLDSYYKDRTGL